MDIEQLQSLCLSFPKVTEDVKWGNLVFSVGGRMFCVSSLESDFSFSFKAGDEEFEEISNREGFEPAPYLARAKWVLVTRPEAMHHREIENYIRQSYELVKKRLTKKMRLELGL